MDKDAYSKSAKADIISTINKELLLDEDILYKLSLELLNVLFSVIRTKSISIDKLRDIISHNVTSNAILQAITNTLQTQSPRDIPRTTLQPQSPIDISRTTPQPQTPIDIQKTTPQPQTPMDIPKTTPQPQTPIDIPRCIY